MTNSGKIQKDIAVKNVEKIENPESGQKNPVRKPKTCLNIDIIKSLHY